MLKFNSRPISEHSEVPLADDGKLELVRKYDVELNGKLQWWTGMMKLPG